MTPFKPGCLGMFPALLVVSVVGGAIIALSRSSRRRNKSRSLRHSAAFAARAAATRESLAGRHHTPSDDILHELREHR